MLKPLQTVLSYHDVKHSYWQYYKQFLPLSDRNRDMHTANTVTVWVLQKYQIEKEKIDPTGWVKIMTFVSFILSSCCHLPLLILLISAGSLFYLVSLSSLSFSVSLSQFFSFLPSICYSSSISISTLPLDSDPPPVVLVVVFFCIWPWFGLTSVSVGMFYCLANLEVNNETNTRRKWTKLHKKLELLHY